MTGWHNMTERTFNALVGIIILASLLIGFLAGLWYSI